MSSSVNYSGLGDGIRFSIPDKDKGGAEDTDTISVNIVSTHRADRGHYARLLKVLRADARFSVQVGASADEVDGDFDVAVVLGDRREMLEQAIQIVEARIPLLHIHGGEHTYGSLDERWRWAISELADVHCAATDEAADELTQNWGDHKIGPTNVFWTGAPGLDDITDRKSVAGVPQVVVLYNPAMDEGTTISERRAILDGLVGQDWCWIKSNGDRFSELIPHSHPELNADSFRDLLASAHVIVGNSSAGIIEAPSLGTWAVNVGERQAGRVRAGNVIDVPAEPVKIRVAIEDALSRPRYAGPNPYRHPQGKACEAIRDVLLGMAK